MPAINQFKSRTIAIGDIHGHIKKEALKLALYLNPAEITVGLDDSYQVGLLSIRFKQERFHLPLRSSCDITTPSQFASRT